MCGQQVVEACAAGLNGLAGERNGAQMLRQGCGGRGVVEIADDDDFGAGVVAQEGVYAAPEVLALDDAVALAAAAAALA